MRIRSYINRKLIVFLLKLGNITANFSDYLKIKITQKNFESCTSNTSSFLKNSLGDPSDNISERVKKFKSRPEAISKSILPNDEELSKVIYLYSIARAVIAILEARIHRLPLQVYNEMRNAFDHYLQAIIVTKDSKNEQLEYRKEQILYMEKHIQRALLDVIKVLCAEIYLNIKNRRKELHTKSLALVNDGKFIGELENKILAAEEAMIHAKTTEYLGRFKAKESGESPSNDVCDSFLRVMILHLDLDDFFREKTQDIYWGVAKFIALNTKTIAVSLIIVVVGGVSGKIIWDAIYDLPFIKGLEILIQGYLS